MQPVTAADRKAGKGRLLGVDAARALALVGMMAVHVLPDTDRDGSISAAYFFASGRSSALFAVLAGLGLALATGGSNPPRGRLYRASVGAIWGRAAIIGFIGLFLGDLNSGVAVILVNYGALFLLGALFISLPTSRLALLAVVWGLLTPVISHYLRMRWPVSSYEVTGFDSLIEPVRTAREVLFTGYYPVFTWMTFLLAGMAVGRTKVSSSATAARLAAVGGALAAGAYAVSWLLLDVLGGRTHVDELPTQFYGVTPTDTWWYLAVPTPHSGTPIDFAHTIGTSLLLLGLLLWGAIRSKWSVAWLAGAGGMTLSLYTAHVVVLSLGWGPDDRVALWLWHAVIALIVGFVWRATIGRGPLENLTANVSGAIKDAVLASGPVSPKGD
jgi:uncharacterized membrane protein